MSHSYRRLNDWDFSAPAVNCPAWRSLVGLWTFPKSRVIQFESFPVLFQVGMARRLSCRRVHPFKLFDSILCHSLITQRTVKFTGLISCDEFDSVFRKLSDFSKCICYPGSSLFLWVWRSQVQY
ncbi:hypothetical protein WP1_281 [Pseudomonas phage WP1]